jgi:hypothetical protein
MHKIFKTRFIPCFWLITSMNLAVCKDSIAQNPQFPIYDDQRIERPSGLPFFHGTEFNINLKRLDDYPQGFIYGDNKTLKKLAEFLLYAPEGQILWNNESGKAARILNNWDFDRDGKAVDRYIYRIFQLENLSFIYIFTGNKILGNFIHDHVLQIAELPIEFWLHAELRGYNPEKPLGILETAGLCSTISMTLTATPDLYSSSEKKVIEEALKTKGLKPCLNYLDKPLVNNYTAVISSGAYIAAEYFDDDEGIAKALKAMTAYINGSIENDGSYGEGVRYFNYPVGSLLPAILIMNNDERQRTFSQSGLKKSGSWIVYPHLFVSSENQKKEPYIVHFGDNGYLSPTKNTVNFLGRCDDYYTSILAFLYKDPVASWLMYKFNTRLDFMERLLAFSCSGEIPDQISPEEAGLPLLKVFDNGDCFMRSTWKDNGIVLGMRSGDGSRIRYSHQRPELSSICMGAYGEYLIVSPGSASYRSTIRFQYDRATKSANTITIDDKNQLFPGASRDDNKDIWMSGKPKAEIVECQSGQIADVIVNEAAQAYHVPMKNMRRSVLFIKDPGYFVVIDKIEALNSLHKYSWRLHFNNRDDSGILNNIDKNHWHLSRPSANLDIYLFSDKKFETRIGQGYMHGADRDYSPGGVNEGKPGSSIELEAYNPEKSQAIIYYSVLYPAKKGIRIPEVDFNEGKLTVGKDSFTFSDGEFIIKRTNQAEKYELW